MKKCEKCLYYKSKEKCGECGRLSNAMDNNPMFTPNTNYDRIKSMSVEEMAEMFFHSWGCEFCVVHDKCREHNYENCTKTIKQWLLREVSDE